MEVEVDDTAVGGLSQCPPLSAQSGDVDADGEILDALRERLDEATGDTVRVERENHLGLIFAVCARRAMERARAER